MVAYPPSVADVPTHVTVPDTVDFSPKKPDGGNYMNGDLSSRTTPAAPQSAAALERRQKGERVSNGNVANYNADNTKDGIGSGTDQYVYYKGDGSTGQGWPDKSRWVSFENM